jgi:hypothetical protein
LASSLDNQLLFPVPCSLKPETSYLTIKITAITILTKPIPLLGNGISRLSAVQLKRYAEICDWTLAHTHAKSGYGATIGEYLGKGDEEVKRAIL